MEARRECWCREHVRPPPPLRLPSGANIRRPLSAGVTSPTNVTSMSAETCRGLAAPLTTTSRPHCRAHSRKARRRRAVETTRRVGRDGSRRIQHCRLDPWARRCGAKVSRDLSGPIGRIYFGRNLQAATCNSNPLIGGTDRQRSSLADVIDGRLSLAAALSPCSPRMMQRSRSLFTSRRLVRGGKFPSGLVNNTATSRAAGSVAPPPAAGKRRRR